MSGTATGTTGVGSYGSSGSGNSGTSSGAYGTSGTSGTGSSATGTMDRTGSTSGSSGSSSGSLQAQDATFLRKAMSSGMEEVQNAQLAMQNAQRSETRSAASMMLEDHQRANQQLESIAQRKGVSSSGSGASAQSDQSRSRLASGGADFDSRYVTEEIRHHRESISDFRKEASSGSDPDLRQFAQDTLPKLEHHLDMLESANTSK